MTADIQHTVTLNDGRELHIEQVQPDLDERGCAYSVALVASDGARVVIPGSAAPDALAAMVEAASRPGETDRAAAWTGFVLSWLESPRCSDVLRAFVTATQEVDRGRWALRLDSEPCGMCRARGEESSGEDEPWR